MNELLKGLKPVQLPNCGYISGAPHIHRTTSIGTDGSVLVRTCKVANGMEYDIHFDYTAPTVSSAMDLLQFCRRESK